MARKSRKVSINYSPEEKENEEVVVVTPKQELKPLSEFAVYRAGIYARLSSEKEEDRERGSIENQVLICKKFVETQEDIVVQKHYYDISMTGTNFERAGFEEMMDDARKGFINCIIVKDLSRLGRNYVDAGNFIERIFPFLGIRFIAVNDNYDSEKNDGSMLLGVTNILNEMYARDVSKKVRASYRTAWEDQKCVAGKLPYGYKRNPDDSHKMIIDEAVADNVRLIFDEYIAGKSCAEIARELNDKGVLTPEEYRKSLRGAKYKKINWQGHNVIKILDNRAYTGDGIHNRYYTSKIGQKVMRENPKEEWIINPNEHPAIVSYRTYQLAEKETKKRREKEVISPGKYSARHLNFFKGKIFCADCGSTMSIGKGWARVNYFCSGHASNRKFCTPHTTWDMTVNDQVLRVIHTHINVYTDNLALIKKINSRKDNVEQYTIFNKEVKRLQKELDRLATDRQRLYEDYVTKIIDSEQYVKFKKEYEEREKYYKAEYAEMFEARARYDTKYKTNKEWDDLINSFRDKRLLTKKMVDAFVKKVSIDEDGNAEVELVYDDMLADLVKFAREREKENEKN